MTKYTKLTILGSSIIAIAFIMILMVLVALAHNSLADPAKPEPKTIKKDTVVVQKIVNSKPDTVRIPAQCRKKHCEEPKPKSQSDSTIINQSTN